MLLAVLAGLLTGILSAWGIGGGTLLVLYMTLFAGVADSPARAINLLYFLPCAGAAVFRYRKDHLVDWSVWRWTAVSGCVCAAVASFFAPKIDPDILRKMFGILLIYMGISTFIKAGKE